MPWFDARVPSPSVRLADTLTSGEASQIRDLNGRAAIADGVDPLSEQFLLSLTAPAGRVRHLLGYAAQRLTGYAQLDSATDANAAAELVVDPDHRRRGVGRGLTDAVLEHAPDARLWAHGRLPAAQALAASAGLAAVRELHKMARPLTATDLDPAATSLPAGFTARSFEPGRDEQAWLATNAAAFAHHPEQGRLTLADLQERMAQPWFDPAGFILVEAEDSPGEVAAFHWTKVEAGERGVGEVYVVGVHPAYQGRGLGRPVTALGLAHLAGLGLSEVELYVDGDNAAALHTYTALGFRSIMVDVMYSRADRPALSG
jgi:mycothiol synthase